VFAISAQRPMNHHFIRNTWYWGIKNQTGRSTVNGWTELSSKVSTTETYTFGDEKRCLPLAVLDLGVKKKHLRNFDDRDVYPKFSRQKPHLKRWRRILHQPVTLYQTAPAIRRLCLMLLKRKINFSIRQADVRHLFRPPVIGFGKMISPPENV